jgi:hypothetical protein
MEQVQIEEYKGKKIVSMNFSDRNKIHEGIAIAKPIIAKFPPDSVLTLTDLTGLVFNSEIIQAFKEFTEHNKPYVKAGAIIGVKGIQKVAYDAVMRFSHRNIPIFATKQEALDWLVKQ